MKADGFIRILRIIFLMLIVGFFCPFASGKIIYVDDDAVGTNDGSSWQNAYTFLQDALADAETAEKPVEIHVAQGTYKPDQGVIQTLGDRTATFQLINDVTIKSGYAGLSEPDPDARDVATYKTFLSGDLEGNDTDVNDVHDLLDESSRFDNSETIVTGNNTNATACLDGFTITAGQYMGGVAGSQRIPGVPSINGGAGMNNVNGSPTIISCTFIENSSSWSGAAMHNVGGSSPTVIDCTFKSNYAEGQGAGMANLDNSNPIVTDCKFSDNVVRSYGGAMYNTSSNPTLNRCTFCRNSVSLGSVPNGGGIYNINSSPVLTNCTFSENSAAFGGGIYNEDSNTVMNVCEFVRNMASRGGGAMSNNGGQPITEGCVFVKNYQGAVRDYSKIGSIFTNCIFIGNSSQFEAGAVKVYMATFTNCIFAGNVVYEQYWNDIRHPGSGGAVLNIHTAVFDNCTFNNNQADLGCAIYCNGTAHVNNCILWGAEDQIHVDDPYAAPTYVRYSNVRGGWPGEGNINADPCFANPGYWADADDPNIVVEPNDPNAVWVDGDYHLKSQAGRWDPASESWVADDVTSPCIDAGDPNSPIGHEPFPNGGIINMGAYGGTIEASKSPSGFHAKYGGGTGEPDNPYQIAMAEDLILLGETPEDCDKHFILTADIDLDPNLPGRKVFDKAVIGAGTFVVIDPNTFIGIDPNTFTGIGAGAFIDYERFEGTPFTGVLDGNGHTISHLTITGESNLGLFGLLENGAIISNLGLEAVNVNGIGDYIGGLVGENSGGTILSCYTSGNISGTWEVGGLAGYNSSGTIAHCYSTGTVRGDRRVGGLVGWNDSEITKCYAASKVLGIKYFGGLVGYSEEIIGISYHITDSYFLATRDGGGPDNGYGFLLTDEKMKKPSSFFDWDFVGEPDGPHDIWAKPVEGGYPILWWQLSPLPELPFLSGKGESNDPYLISTADKLNSIGHNPRLLSAHFKLINDIDLAGVDFFIIGSEIFPFAGVFDGNNHTISNFNHTTKYDSFVGLFGYVKGPRAEIRDLGLINPNINQAIGDVGSLAGYFGDGTISNCYADCGSVNGYGVVGGLVGSINGSITNCHSSTTVSGTETVGGLVGSVVGLIGSNEYTGTVSNCYSTGSVSGDRNVGGLVGNNHGHMTDCYTTGNVSGVESVGGLVGSNSFGYITKCYAAAGVAGNVSVGGLVGMNNYTSTISNCYSIGSVSGGGIAGGMVGANIFGHMMNCYARAAVKGYSYVGGLVGYNLEGSILSCYSTGNVIGTEKIGGLVGENTSIPNQQGQYNTDIIGSSFWDTEASGQTISAGGTGKTTAEMQTASTFLEAGWDFVGETANGTEDIWWILEGQDYPRLWWELIEGNSTEQVHN